MPLYSKRKVIFLICHVIESKQKHWICGEKGRFYEAVDAQKGLNEIYWQNILTSWFILIICQYNLEKTT